MAIGSNASVGTFGGGGAPTGDQVWEGFGDALADDPTRGPELAATLARQVVDPLTGSGWTQATLSGTATAAWSTGPARLSLSIPATTDGACHAYQAGLVPDGDEWDALCRVQITAGDGAANTRLILQVGTDADNLYALALYADGTLEPGRTVATVYTSAGTASGPSSGQRTGGQLWLRLSRRTTGIAAYWGVGSAGAVPTSWTLVVPPETGVAAIGAAQGTYFRIVHTAFGGGVAGGFAADVLAIRVRGLAGVGL
jgi:hypothetical protein